MFPIVVEEGTVLIKEGDLGEEMYIVEYGEFNVSIKDQFKNKMGPGDVFGELALLHGIPRTATVTAVKKSRVWSAEQTSFSCIRIRDQIYRKSLIRETIETNKFFKDISDCPETINKILDLCKSIFIDADSPFEIYENEVAVVLKEGIIDDGVRRKVYPKDLIHNDFESITDLECVVISLEF
jgi:cAMP-dependent protein kinase regulator